MPDVDYALCEKCRKRVAYSPEFEGACYCEGCYDTLQSQLAELQVKYALCDEGYRVATCDAIALWDQLKQERGRLDALYFEELCLWKDVYGKCYSVSKKGQKQFDVIDGDYRAAIDKAMED